MAERDPHIIGARIAKRRHQLDMTQVELAAALGVSPSSVADWERGATYPRRKLGKIEEVLGISLDADAPPPLSQMDELRGIAARIEELTRRKDNGNDSRLAQ